MGVTSTRSFAVEIIADDENPEITEVKLDEADVNEGDTINVQSIEGAVLSIKASDNVGVTSIVVKVGDEEHVAVDGKYTFEALEPGEHTIVITAKDAAGNVATFTFTLNVTEDV